MGIRIDDISFEYERGTAMQVTALDHISAEIPDNQFIGLIGHTGSGKSTFVQTLNGLLKPTSGHIYYNGEDINGENFDKKKLRSDVGLVFQYPEHQLFEIDVLTDVMFGPKNLGLSDEEAKKRALEALESVHMPEKYYKSSPFDLSGGQKRRAAIAGVYGNDFGISLCILLSFIVPSLVLGLLLRKPVIRLNHWMERQLESTKVM